MAGNRDYLIYDDVLRDVSLEPLFDNCIVAISGGKIRATKTRAQAGYPSYDCFRVDGREIIVGAVLEYYLSKLARAEFSYIKARDFTEIMRKLCGWKWDIDRTLRAWVDKVIRNPFFYDDKSENDMFYHNWKLKDGQPEYRLAESYLEFACYIAVCHVKYGEGYEKATADEIFKYVTALGSNLPKRLKVSGSGDLPKDIAEYKDAATSCKANDAFATVKITLKEETEDAYRSALLFLCRLLEYGFPRSFAVDFKSDDKNILPIKGLPKKGIHHLFANAVKWQSLYELIERYARLAMHEDAWYENLINEHCAMPGTFAIFALGIADESYSTLICDYLEKCDGEHQNMHGLFMLAYIEKFGFTRQGLELYDLCEKNIQHMPQKLVAMRTKHFMKTAKAE